MLSGVAREKADYRVLPGKREGVCDGSVRERVGLLCSCTLIFVATGLLGNQGECVGWRGSDTGRIQAAELEFPVGLPNGRFRGR